MADHSKELKDVLTYMDDTILKNFPTREKQVYQLLCSIFDNKSCKAYKVMDGLLMSSAMSALKQTFAALLTETKPIVLRPNMEHKMSDGLSTLMSKAEEEMKSLSDAELSTIHILLALRNPDNSTLLYFDVFEKFKSVGLTYQAVKKKAGGKDTSDSSSSKAKQSDSYMRDYPYLKQFTTPIHSPSQPSKLIGRDDTMELIMTAMSRMDRRSVVIVGDSGVGKTAIVEEFARRVSDGMCPITLCGKKVLSLSVSSILAGTTLRGMMEERMNGIMNELSSNKDIILYIDGIEQMLNSGSSESDMTTLLEQLVSMNSSSVIAATNRKSYHSKFEPSKKIASSFTKIEIDELPVDTVDKIVGEKVGEYEKFHKVKFDDDVVSSIAQMSKRYINSTRLPMSAIDLMDILGASKSSIDKRSSELAELDRSLSSLEGKKRKCKSDGDFSESESLSDGINELKQKKAELLKTDNAYINVPVSMEDLKRTLSQMTGIDTINTSDGSLSSLKGMEDRIKSKVIGQDAAVDKVCRAIRRNKVGLKRSNKTIGSFLMIGSTGCGKTLLAKNIASQVFGSDKSMIRIDMSEYSEESSVGKLIGSAPGYIGYDQGGQLTEFVKHKPYCVLLLDEIEKANQKVINVFLQVLDEGRLTDNSGEVVDFTNTLVLMTSNVGAKRASEFKHSIGFSSEDKSQEVTEKELTKFFPPEFINRIDDVIYFNKLSSEDLRKIVSLELSNLETRVNELGYDLSVYEGIVDDVLASVKGKEDMGARPIIRAIQDMIEARVTDAIVDGVEGKNIILKKEWLPK